MSADAPDQRADLPLEADSLVTGAALVQVMLELDALGVGQDFSVEE